jgi:hypothetical protein
MKCHEQSTPANSAQAQPTSPMQAQTAGVQPLCVIKEKNKTAQNG